MFLFLLFCFLICINPAQSDVPENRRIDCAPGRIKNKDFCVSKGCIWDDNGEPDTVPLCYFPANTGYIVAPGAFSAGDKTVNLKKSSDSVQNPFGTDFTDLTFQWKEIGAGVYIKIEPSQFSLLLAVSPESDLQSPPYIPPPIIFEAKLNGQLIAFQHDTGAATTVINERKWINIGSPVLSKSSIRLRSYNGNIPVMGVSKVAVQIGLDSKKLWVTVVKASDAILGRD